MWESPHYFHTTGSSPWYFLGPLAAVGIWGMNQGTGPSNSSPLLFECIYKIKPRCWADDISPSGAVVPQLTGRSVQHGLPPPFPQRSLPSKKLKGKAKSLHGCVTEHIKV